VTCRPDRGRWRGDGRRGARGPAGRFIRARLHRRLFLWFGATIVVTVALVGAVSGLMHRAGGSGWRWDKDIARAQAFVGNQLARTWDDPAERDALARAMAEDLGAGVELMGPAGERIVAHGEPCGRRAWRVPVRRGEEALGAALICFERARSPVGPLPFILPLAVIAGALWAASGLISRRLTRPLSELARVAREIGEGNLGSRVRLDCRQPDEVGVVAETVNDMAARIEKQLADQRELLAVVSHELRTPLARIRLLTEMARGYGGSTGLAPAEPPSVDRNAGPGPRLFDDLDREVEDIDALVGDLLASSRLDFNALTPSHLAPAEVGIRALERAGLDPTLLEVDEGVPPSFEADATLLARALANLIGNARAHGGGVARLRVRPARLAAEGIAFDVEDQGPGIAEGDEARVFEPFYRRERGDKGGERGSLGLGLALCKRIAEAHGGRAYAENREGGGARVGVEIALRPPPRIGALGDPASP